MVFSRTLLVVLLGLFCSYSAGKSTVAEQAILPEELMQNLIKANAQIKCLRYTFTATERIKGKIETATSLIKLQVLPFKLYLLGKSAELLWTPNEKSNAVLVKPFSFPYFPMNLDPMNAILRSEQHHSLYEAGFDYFVKIMQHAYQVSKSNKAMQVVITGEEVVNHRSCYKLVFINADFGFVKYTVLKGENLHGIAMKLFVSEAMILEHNPQFHHYNDVKEGYVVLVPNSYSKMSTVLIDKLTFLPVSSKIYDSEGLFESYEFDDLEVNGKLLPEEFTRNFKSYHF